MALKQLLEQRTTQRLSPQQIQVIRLLELTSIELEERIKQEIIENPALEEGSDTADNSGDKEVDNMLDGDDISVGGDNEDISLGDYISTDDIPDYKLDQYEKSRDENRQIELPFISGSTLQDHLQQQLNLLTLEGEELNIAKYIIGNLDNDGYLHRALNSVSDDLLFQVGVDVSVEKLQEILNIIQECDPAGVGATSLQECLLLQLNRNSESEVNSVAKEIIETQFQEFSKKHYDKIQRNLNINQDILRRAIKEITLLNPKPGNVLNNSYSDSVAHIIPDFIIENTNGVLSFTLNNSTTPHLKVNQNYINMYQDYVGNKKNQTKQTHDALLFIKQKLDSAQQFISAINQRQETITKTMQAIIAIQSEYFITGNEEDLRPMILKDVAKIAQYDISTISRTINGKYFQSEFGIYPLKYLFSESMQNKDGKEISTREIKRLLVECIENEDKQQPLSDDILCEQLQKHGYNIARRTVAKYREQAGIAVARLRKEI